MAPCEVFAVFQRERTKKYPNLFYEEFLQKQRFQKKVWILFWFGYRKSYALGLTLPSLFNPADSQMFLKFADKAVLEQMPPCPPGKKYSLSGNTFRMATS